MNSYELCVIFSADYTDAEIESKTAHIDQMLSEAEAVVKIKKSLGRKKFAYKIKGNNYGEYWCWYFDATGEKILPFSTKLKMSGACLRYLINSLNAKIFESRMQKIQNISAEKAGPKKPATQTIQEEKTIFVAEEKAGLADMPEDHKQKAKKAPLEDLDHKLDEILNSDKI